MNDLAPLNEDGALAALVASRLCHDLVNPLGAIGNGVELLGMTGGQQSPEMELISDAVRDAQARVRFFRMAFGASQQGQMTSLREARTILSDLYDSGRLDVTWTAETDLPRAETKIGFLMIACAESALPMGGDITVSRLSEGQWHLNATGARVLTDKQGWSMLDRTSAPANGLRPAEVHFLLLRQEAMAHNAQLNLALNSTEIEITFSF